MTDGKRHFLLSPFNFLLLSSRWHAIGAATWFPWALGAGVVIGWLAVQVQRYRAPLVVFPLLLGLLLALALVCGLRACSLAHAPTAYIGAVLAAVLVIGGQHCWSYRAALDARSDQQVQFEKAKQAFPDVANRMLGPPPGDVLEYLRAEADGGRELFGHRVRGAWLWGWWALDAALVFLAAVTPIVWALRQPYCTRCRSWLRASRRGRVTAVVTAQLARRCGLDAPKEAGMAHYRLLTCRAGCSPSAFELSWDQGSKTCRAWLDAEGRRAVSDVLDRATG